jgi:phosphoribosyl-ATP pyrophosphohydrolase/phosphoribosyl-AMP cyclohydrolase
MTMQDIAFLVELESVIRDRLATNRPDSYTAQLARSGQRRIAQKVGEEAVELVLAATGSSQTELLEEAADLIYHLLLLLAVQKTCLADVAEVLAKRHDG